MSYANSKSRVQLFRFIGFIRKSARQPALQAAITFCLGLPAYRVRPLNSHQPFRGNAITQVLIHFWHFKKTDAKE